MLRMDGFILGVGHRLGEYQKECARSLLYAIHANGVCFHNHCIHAFKYRIKKYRIYGVYPVSRRKATEEDIIDLYLVKMTGIQLFLKFD